MLKDVRSLKFCVQKQVKHLQAVLRLETAARNNEVGNMKLRVKQRE